MVLYRRNRVEGGTYFFTVTLRDRSAGLLVEHIDFLRLAYRAVQQDHPFETVAIVILPEHIHAIWTLPEGDADYSGRWRSIKAKFSRALARAGKAHRCEESKELDVWQRRFWEHTIRDEDDLCRHMDYVHFNPVKHGHVHAVVDWPHSSFHRYVARGLLPADWAGRAEEGDGGYGE